MKVLAGGFTELSTIDYPGEIASVIFLGGCPYRCPFCQNFPILDEKNCKEVEVSQVLDKVMENRPLITGTCITGGEPTLQNGQVAEICRRLKAEGLKVKLDTNGYDPEGVKALLPFIDFVAIDVKAPLDPQKYANATGVQSCKGLEKVKKTLEILSQSGIKFEVRTTVVPELIDKEEDLLSIASSLRVYGVDKYVLQQFRPEMGTLDKEYEKHKSPQREYLLDVATKVRELIPNVSVRTKENGEEKVS